MNLNDVLEMLKQQAEKNAGTIQKLSDKMESTEKQIENADNTLQLLESCYTQTTQEREELIKTYREIVSEVRRKKATACVNAGINKVLIKDEDSTIKLDCSIEKAERALEKEESISQTHVMSNILNDYRYIERRTDITDQERYKLLLRLCDKMSAETDKLRDMIGN